METQFKRIGEQIAFMRNVTGLHEFIVSIDARKAATVACFTVIGPPQTAALTLKLRAVSGRGELEIGYFVSTEEAKAAIPPRK